MCRCDEEELRNFHDIERVRDVIHGRDSGFRGKSASTIFEIDSDAGLKVPRMFSPVFSAMLVG